MADNPFNVPREARTVTLTFRMTPTEHKAVQARAEAEGKDLVDVVREGLALVLDRPVQRAAGPRKAQR
jgi:hypothetical protein